MVTIVVMRVLYFFKCIVNDDYLVEEQLNFSHDMQRPNLLSTLQRGIPLSGENDPLLIYATEVVRLRCFV